MSELDDLLDYTLDETFTETPLESPIEITDSDPELRRLITTHLADQLVHYEDNYISESFVIPYPLLQDLDNYITEDLFYKNCTFAIDRIKYIISTETSVPIEDIFIGINEIPYRTTIGNITNKNVNKHVCFEAIVRKTESMLPKIDTAYYFCKACGYSSSVGYGKHGSYIHEPNSKCPICNKTMWMKDLDRTTFINVQRITVQDSSENANPGSQPHSINVDLLHNQINSALPGQRVIIFGIVRPELLKGTTEDPRYELVVDCLHIEFPEKDHTNINLSPEDIESIKELANTAGIYNLLKNSIAPTIYGMDAVKTALCLSLFGGVSKETENHKQRGDIHIFLVGDPGVAKSELLDFMALVSPRCVQTSGKGASAAGLTATAVQSESGRWTLEAGALPLADKGICIIDELDKMREADKGSLHRGMEQQCYDDTTEVLTQNGWKLFKNIEFSDKIATLSKEDELEYHNPITIFEAPYSGEMYRFKSRQVDLLVTPNHNMYVNTNKRANEWNGFKLIRADSLSASKRMKFKTELIQKPQNEPSINTNGRTHISKEHYEGTIYCVEVPNHIIYVRRNGCPVWCGNSIPITKAGICATLQTRCTIIAAANPKNGRFNDMEHLGAQIEVIDDALLSRFDLIFALRDRPQQELDSKIADHILSQYTPETEPPKVLDPIFIKKYVSYAKMNIFPVLSKEATDVIKTFFMKLRGQVSENHAIAITHRCLKGLVRLTQASARIRLSNTANRADAEQSVKLLEHCMRDIAFDHSTGSFDIDMITTKIGPKSRQDKLFYLRETIKSLCSEMTMVPVTHLEETVTKSGIIDPQEFEILMNILSTKGEITYPQHHLVKIA